MSQPLISVIMPAYNGEQYIAGALNSLLREAGLNLDIIVVDDGSTDGTGEIVSHYVVSHPVVRLINGPHAGVSQARNTGLAAVPEQARYITFLDCDDLNSPGRIKRQLDMMRSDPGLGCVMGLMQLFESADEENCRPLPGSKTMIVRGVQLSAVLFSREVFKQIGHFNEQMQHGEDTDFFLRLLEAKVPYALDEEVAVMYRRHLNNMTNDTVETRRGFIDAIRRSLARRRENGSVVDLGELFKTRGNAEEIFSNA